MSKQNNRRCSASPRIISPTAVAEPEKDVDSAAERNGIGHRISAFLSGRWWLIAVIAVLSLSASGATWRYLEQDAARQLAARRQATYLKPAEETLLSKVNPFLDNPTPTPTPQLSKEYLYAGQRLLSVIDANASEAIPTDLAVWRPSNGTWYVMGAGNTVQASASWGASGDIPVAGDYDGDGKTDFAVYRNGTTASPNSNWYIIKSSDGSYIFQGWGTKDDVPVPADYDGDHRTDIAIYRPSTFDWYIYRSSDQTLQTINYGTSGDKPAPADYDGDGKADATVFRASNSTFYSYLSANGGNGYGQLSATINTGQTPVPADYDGDGKADYAMRSSNDWLIRSSANGGAVQTVSWYSSTDTAVQNDYDGDGKVDIAVWRGSTGSWYIRQSSHVGQSNELRTEGWGQQGDTPVPALWRR